MRTDEKTQSPGALQTRAAASDARPGAMAEAEFDREYAQIRSVYGDSSTEAAARRDQALADLVWRSFWTQMRLAARMKMSQQRVGQLMLLGRFLNYATTRLKLDPLDALLRNTTERKFRSAWARTNPDAVETDRFCQAWSILQADRDGVTKRVVESLVESFGGQGWRTEAQMAEDLDCDPELIAAAVRSLKRSQAKRGPMVDTQRIEGQTQVRIHLTRHVVPALDVFDGLKPHLAALDKLGVPAVTAEVDLIKAKIETWCGDQSLPWDVEGDLGLGAGEVDDRE
jgi:hypothetical protein